MSSPARDTRLAASANGFTEVVSRGKNFIACKNPDTKKISLDIGIGTGWHYNNNTLETDTAWEADTDINYLKMVKAPYNARARKLFNAGDLLKWTDPSTGEYVILQPNNLSWIDNVTGSQHFISSPASVTGVSSGDVINWTNGYGTGRHFRYTAGTGRMVKHLIIDAASNLPTPTVSNPYLEIAFVMTPSTGVSLITDGVAWDKKTAKTTAKAIEFRTSGGVTLWSFSAPIAYDSSSNSANGILQLKKQSNNLIVSVRIPKSFFDSATYPVYIDPTVDYQVGASGDDCSWITGRTYSNSATYIVIGNNTLAAQKCAVRFTGVTIPASATITTSYLSFYYSSKSGTPPACTLSAEDAADPSAITGNDDGDGRTLTTANISVTGPGTGTWWNTNSINTIVQELVNSYSYASGSAMQFIIVGGSGNSNYEYEYSYDYSTGTRAAKLHIEYTEATSGKPYYAYAQQ